MKSNPNDFYIGLSLVVGQSLLGSFCFLLNNPAQNQTAAKCLMIVANLINLAAYAFAPVALVAPLSALALVFSAIMAAIFAREKLNIFAQLGCALCLFGTTLLAIFVPKEMSIDRLSTSTAKFVDNGSFIYASIFLGLNLVLILYADPKWGSKVPFIPITITASFASISVLGAIEIGAAVKQGVLGGAFPMLAVTLAALVVSSIFLNRAVGRFGANLVTPALYVEFTALSIVGSAILYNDTTFTRLEYHSICAIVVSYLNMIVGVMLVSSRKSFESGNLNCSLCCAFASVSGKCECAPIRSSTSTCAAQSGVLYFSPPDAFAAAACASALQTRSASTNAATPIRMETGKHTIGVGTFKITEKQRLYVNDVLDKERLSYGPYAQKFEAQFAQLHDCRFGVMTNSGTCCLLIALAALKNKYNWADGDEVIVPAVTFVATANIVLQLNMKPVFVDVDPLYYEIEPDKIEPAITSRTRCIIPVHLFGQPCEMDRIFAIAQKHKLRLIEDSCESMFVKYKGRSVGAWSDIGCFSTYIAHILSTGVGGVCTTQDPELAVELRSLMNHGRDSIYLNVDDDKNKSQKELEIIIKRRFRFVQMGYSFRVTEMEAALGLAQLEDYQTMMDKRWKNGTTLTKRLQHLSEFIQTPAIRDGAGHAFMMYPIVVRKDTKVELVNYLEDHGIETRDMLPLTNQPIYKTLLGTKEEDYPTAHWINQSGFYIASHQNLSDEDIDHMVTTLTNFFIKTK